MLFEGEDEPEFLTVDLVFANESTRGQRVEHAWKVHSWIVGMQFGVQQLGIPNEAALAIRRHEQSDERKPARQPGIAVQLKQGFMLQKFGLYCTDSKLRARQ
jgi:hypothetical protein